jgi:hypothetical protein
MTAEQAAQRINTLLAHAWMVRTFLKHADEIQEDEEMLEVHRMIFDYVRALEPSYQRQDFKEYLHRARGKLPKLKRVAEFFAREFRRISDHTNFQMAAASLSACVQEIEAALAAVKQGEPLNEAADLIRTYRRLIQSSRVYLSANSRCTSSCGQLSMATSACQPSRRRRRNSSPATGKFPTNSACGLPCRYSGCRAGCRRYRAIWSTAKRYRIVP